YLSENPEQCVLIDDETYMKMDTRKLPGSQFHTIAEGEDVKESNKTICVGKLDEKVPQMLQHTAVDVVFKENYSGCTSNMKLCRYFGQICPALTMLQTP
ncbi:hypothetical protein ILUMI_16427, partial [Ignelater luminosus]